MIRIAPHLLPLPVLLPALLLAACAGAPPTQPVEATSLLGNELLRPIPSVAARARHGTELAGALERWEATGEEDDAVWAGRQLAYLGRYREAVDWYGARLADFPASARLLRHRGHRLITLRRFPEAIADLERAWELCRDEPDAVERDGMPNAAGVPVSSLQTNVLYHLALARYLSADFEGAANAWREGLARSTNDDMRVANANWLVLSLRRLDREDEAAAVLAGVDLDAELLENEDYRLLLRLHAGEGTLFDVDPAPGIGVQGATRGYGLGAYMSLEGHADAARDLWAEVVATTPWSAFGHIAAEAELARGVSEPREHLHE